MEINLYQSQLLVKELVLEVEHQWQQRTEQTGCNAVRNTTHLN